MSLIFSKENRILFNHNRENSDSLLELTYNNRLIPLQNTITTKIKKENKAFFKLSSKIFFDIRPPKKNLSDQFANNNSQRVIEDSAQASPILNSHRCNIQKMKTFTSLVHRSNAGLRINHSLCISEDDASSEAPQSESLSRLCIAPALVGGANFRRACIAQGLPRSARVREANQSGSLYARQVKEEQFFENNALKFKTESRSIDRSSNNLLKISNRLFLDRYAVMRWLSMDHILKNAMQRFIINCLFSIFFEENKTLQPILRNKKDQYLKNLFSVLQRKDRFLMLSKNNLLIQVNPKLSLTSYLAEISPLGMQAITKRSFALNEVLMRFSKNYHLHIFLPRAAYGACHASPSAMVYEVNSCGAVLYKAEGFVVPHSVRQSGAVHPRRGCKPKGMQTEGAVSLCDISQREANRRGCIAEGDISHERGKPKGLYRYAISRSARQTEGAVSLCDISHSEASIARQANARHHKAPLCRPLALQAESDARQAEDQSLSTKKQSVIFLRKNTESTIKGEQTNLQNQDYKDKNNNVGAFLKNFIFRNHFYTHQKFVPHFFTFKEKVSSIKKRVPQVNKWSFVFGSSFLLLIMISILERQELSMWYFSFLKRQMPGVYTFYEEASWESFENIISKHLIKNNSISLADTYKAPLCKHQRASNLYQSSKNRAYLLKKLDLQKDSLQLDFSKVWDLQLRKDFTGVFPASNDFPKKSFACLTRDCDRSSQSVQNSALYAAQASGNAPMKTHQRDTAIDKTSQRIASRSEISPSAIQGMPYLAASEVSVARHQRCTSFENTSGQSLYDNFNPSTICKKVPCLPRCARVSGANQRSLLEPFYKMNARIPCHHLLNAPKTNQSLLLSVTKRSFIKPKSFQRLTKNNIFKERVFCANNSIPSKMSSSVTTVFANNYKIRSRIRSLLKNTVFEAFTKQKYFLEKTKKNQSKPDKISEKKNDILKKFFYEYGFFYIPTQALSTPPPEEDFLKASEFKTQLQETISSQLYCYAKENFKEVSTKSKSSCFENLATVSPKAYLAETSPSAYLADTSLPLYSFPIAQSTTNPQLLTAPVEKISCYILRKTHELKPRLLSGYKSAEIQTFEQSRAYKSLISRHTKKPFNKKVLIKIPPTLPCFSREFFSKFQCCIPTFSKLDKEAVRVYNKIFMSRNRKERLQQKIGEVRTFKKIPYKQLALDEFQEIKSLFEKISKENRISPHNLTFKNPFFTDYNDYLNRPKDSPGAIAISPSLEEDQSIQQSWIDHIEKQKAVNQTLEKRKQSFENNNFWGSSKEKDSYTKDFSSNEKRLEKTELDKSSLLSPSLRSLHDNDTLSVHKQQGANSKMPFPDKDQSSSLIDRDSNTVTTQVFFESQNEDDRNSGAEMDEEKELNEEEKKKEITKWEWLHSVRESELNVEKRKEFQKLAYPHKEALFTKRLQSQTALKTPVFRNLQNFFVSDRKSSFFGITDLFPKRLIAEEQRQINHQILQKDYDQRSVHFFISLNKKKLPIKQDFSKSPKKNHTCMGDSELLFLEKVDFKENSNQKKKKVSKNQLLETENSSKHFTNALQIAPRLLYEEAPKVELQASESCYQHPIYTPNRRLRLRIADLSKSAQNNNPQARVDYLNSCQSHRWWQKRRVTSSLLGAPSKRYMAMPEITRVAWRKIIEWQLKTYFLEEEKRLQPLIVSKGAFKKAPDFGLSQQGVDNNFSLTQKIRSENSLIPKVSSQEILFDQEKSRDLKIKKIAIYLPWVTLKKNLKKPFEWPLTRLSYQSSAGACLADASLSEASATPQARQYKGARIRLPHYAKHELCKEVIDSQNGMVVTPYFVHNENKVEETILFSRNRKPDLCLISSLSPNRQALPFTFTIGGDNIGKIKREKHFIFEIISKDSHLLFHQLLLAVAIKQIFQKIYHLFGKIITDKIKNSSFSLALLPLFFNAYSHKHQISGVYNLNKRLKDLVGSEDSISSLSEIVWYLRNSCRGRMVPRGVVLLETEDSESTEFLKAVGGEAQVPVIVESLRALPFTQNHPQRRLEKILKFAEKSAPCILFLDDLDAIGKERSLLINQNGDANSMSSDTASSQKQKGNHNTFLSFNKSSNFLRNAGSIKIANEKEKWKICKKDLIAQNNNLGIKKRIGLTSVTKQSCVNRPFSPREKTISNHARPVFGKYNMLLKTLLSQKTKSQEVHTFLLNSFRANNKSSNNAYLTGTYSSLNINKSSYVGPETERLMEQRRLDLMLRLLTVMDGISHLKGVLIVTTSKNPSSLDPALLRPGRFERFIHLKLPNKRRRIQLLKVQTSKIGHVNPMPWEHFGKEIENMSGTSISNAINHSAFQAIIQSTAHTPTTLEYGINRVKGVKTSRLNQGKVLTSFVDSFSHNVKTQSFRPYKIAHTNLRFALIKSKQNCRSYLADAYKGCITSKKVMQPLYAPARYQAGKGILQSLFDSNKQKELLNLKFSDFTENFVKFHAGRASENLYLDSKSRTSEDIYQFLQFNQSYLEQLEAIFSISSVLNEQTRFQFLASRHNFNFKGIGPILKSSLINILSTAKLYKNPLQPAGDVEHKMKSFGFFSKNLGSLMGLPRYVRVCLACVSLKRRFAKQTKTNPRSACLACLATLTSPASLREAPARYGTREFASPSETQTITFGLPRLCEISPSAIQPRKGCTARVCFSRSEVKSVHRTTEVRQQRQMSSSAQFLGINKDYWFEEKLCEILKTLKKSPGNWYRLYLPELSDSKSNREWRIPDRFFNQSLSLLNIKSIFQSAKQTVLKNSDLSYYNVALSSFYISFQSLNENRELLDLFADHLLRFKSLRTHEIMRISLFYIDASSFDQS